MTTTTQTTLTGYEAIEHHKQTGATLRKCADPTEGPKAGLTIYEAMDVIREDPALIWCEVKQAS